jgi:hypothetical protein
LKYSGLTVYPQCYSASTTFNVYPNPIDNNRLTIEQVLKEQAEISSLETALEQVVFSYQAL